MGGFCENRYSPKMTHSRRLIQRTLELAGYDVVAVENGCLAAECLSSAGGPQFAPLDWKMPVLVVSQTGM